VATVSGTRVKGVRTVPEAFCISRGESSGYTFATTAQMLYEVF